MNIQPYELIATLFNVDESFAKYILTDLDTDLVIKTIKELRELNPNNDLHNSFDIVVAQSFNEAIDLAMKSINENPEININHVAISYIDSSKRVIEVAVVIDEKQKELFSKNYLESTFNQYSNFELEIKYGNVNDYK